MEIYSHGADIYTAAEVSGLPEAGITDFSSNINPLGMPAAVKEAVHRAVDDAWRYPDSKCRRLRQAIGLREGVPQEWVFCANGAAEAIYRIIVGLKPNRTLLTTPTFGEYEEALWAVGCNRIDIHTLREKEGFVLTSRIFTAIEKKTDMVFICNPNNPTGLLADRSLVSGIVKRCHEVGAVAVIDECFLDFVDGGNDYSMVNMLRMYDNLIVLKAFTKIYAMAGLRLGYCLSSNGDTMNRLMRGGPPWNVSSLAQAAGLAALDEADYIGRTVDYVSKEREYLMTVLQKNGMKVFASAANYVFFRCEGELAKSLKQDMLQHGILIRSCDNYRGLKEGYYRIAVRTAEENQNFARILSMVVNGE